jgi:hypothetical protein
VTAIGIGSEWTVDTVIATLERAWLQARRLATYSENPRVAVSQLDSLVVIFDGMSPFHQGGRIEQIVADGGTLAADSPLIASLNAALQGEFFWSLFLSDARDAVARRGRVQLDVVARTARVLDHGAATEPVPQEENIRAVAYLAADALGDAWDYARRQFSLGEGRPDLLTSHIESIVLRFGVPSHFRRGGAVEYVIVDGERFDGASRLIALIELLQHDDRWSDVLAACHWDLDGLGGLVEFVVWPTNARIVSRAS